MRVWVERTKDWMPKRGFGLWYRYGRLGSTYGEEGIDMSATITFLFLLWTWEIRFSWKKLES